MDARLQEEIRAEAAKSGISEAMAWHVVITREIQAGRIIPLSAEGFDPNQPRDDQGRWTDAGGPATLITQDSAAWKSGKYTEPADVRGHRKNAIERLNQAFEHPRMAALRKERPDKYAEFRAKVDKAIKDNDNGDMWRVLSKRADNPPDWPGASLVLGIVNGEKSRWT